jgi:hypothetical protein
MARKQLDELSVGGGQTGVSMVPSPSTKKTTLPNSKQQGDMNPQSIDADQNGQQDTNPENNTAPTGDLSAHNKASVSMKEHIDAMFNGEDLSEEFKDKASTIFEAAIYARLQEEVEALEEAYAAKLEESVTEIAEELSSKLDDYLNYCVEQWMKENEVAIEESLRSEITEDFMDGLKNLFAENYIEIPEDKLDVLEALTTKVEELEDKLNAQISENIEMAKSIDNFAQYDIFNQVAEGLALTQVDKLRQLAEGIDFDDADSYHQKLLLVKENYFPVSQPAYQYSEEDYAIGNNDLNEETQVSFQDNNVKRYFSAIARTNKV